MSNSYVFVFKNFEGTKKFSVVQFVLNQPSVVRENGEEWRNALDVFIDSDMFWTSFKEVNVLHEPVNVAFVSVSEEIKLDSLELCDLVGSISDNEIRAAVNLVCPGCNDYKVCRPAENLICCTNSCMNPSDELNSGGVSKKKDILIENKERTGLTHEFFVEKHRRDEKNRIYKSKKR